MAENLDPSIIQELNDRFSELTSTSNSLGTSFINTASRVNNLGSSFQKLSDQISKITGDQKKSSTEEVEAEKKATDAIDKRRLAEEQATISAARNAKEHGDVAKRILQTNSSVEGALDTMQSRLLDLAGGGTGAVLAFQAARIAVDGFISVMKTAYDAQVAYTKSILSGERGQQVVAKQTEAVGKAFNQVIDQIGNFLIGLGAVTAMMGGPLGMAFGALSAAAGVGAKMYAKASDTALEFATQLAGLKDKLFTGFNELGKASMIGAGGMTELHRQLGEMQMSMAEVSEFTSLVKGAGKELRLLGPSTSESLKTFVGTAGGLIKSELGRTLETMGITAQDQREHTISFLTTQARLGLGQKQTQEQLVKSAGKYILEMDKLAELTGATRKEQEDARNQILAIEELRAAVLDASSEAEKQRLEKVLKNAEALYAAGAKGMAAGIAKAGAAGGAITSVEAAKARMASPEAFDRMVQGQGTVAENLKLFGKESKAFAKQFAGVAKYNAEPFKNVLPDMFGATTEFGDKMAKAEEEAAKKGLTLDDYLEKQRQVTDDETIKQVDLLRKQREDAILNEKSAGTLSHATGQFNRAVDKFGSIIEDYSTKMFGKKTSEIITDPTKALEKQKKRDPLLQKQEAEIMKKADMIDKAQIYAAKGVEAVGSLLGKGLSAVGLEGAGSRVQAVAGAAKESRIESGMAEVRKREGDPLAGLNFGGRKEERTGGGEVDPNLLAMAHKINETFPGVVITALNDKFHQENRKTSKHTVGKALDFAMNPPPKDAKEAADISTQLKDMGASKVLDEYFAHKTAKTTGGHFHVEMAHDGGFFRSASNDFNGEFPVLLKSNEYVLTEKMVENIKERLGSTVKKEPISTAFPEAVTPSNMLNNNLIENIKERLGSTVEKEPVTRTLPEVATPTNTITDNSSNEMISVLIKYQEEFSDKLDSVIGAMESSVEIQRKLLSYSRV